jgi:hypothetical protein
MYSEIEPPTSRGLMKSVAPSAFRHFELVRIQVDGQDAPGLRHHRTLHHGQPDAAEAEHRDGGTRFDFRRVEHRADAGGDAATEQADLVQRRRRVDLGQRDFRHHGVFGEGGTAHVVEDRRAVLREAAGAVRHVTGPDGGGDGLAQIGFRRGAVFAIAAFRDVQRNDMIARLQRLHARAAFHHDATALMAEDAGKGAFRIVAGERERIGMADAAGDHFQQHLSFTRTFDIDFLDGERLFRFPGNGGTRFHEQTPDPG